jgi:cytoskeletal protein RodZ
MPNLKLAAGAAATKSLLGRRKGTRAKRGAWLTSIKVALLLERWRRRGRQPQRSSPSLRQIALVVVSAGLAIMVIRVVLRRKGAGAETAPVETAQAETAPVETAQAETAQADTAQAETAQADTAQAETAQADTAQAETAQADTAQAETAQADTQAAAGEAASTPPTPGDDTVTATESTLTDTVQSEMSRRDDAPAPATGAD